VKSRELCPNGASLEHKNQFVRKIFNDNFTNCKKDHCKLYSYKSICCEFCLKFNENYKNKSCNIFDSNPCYNGGKCMTNGNSFYCKCPIGYQGELCLRHNPCDLNPCQENEICMQFGSFGNFYCLCSPDNTEYPFCRTSFGYNYLTGSQVTVKKQFYRWFLNISLLGGLIVISFLHLILCFGSSINET